MKNVTVALTDTEIEAAVADYFEGRNLKECCPVARVVRTMYPTAIVYVAAWRAVDDPERPSGPSAPLPVKVVGWIASFDAWAKRVAAAASFGGDLAGAVASTTGRPAPATFSLPVPS